MAIYHCSLKVFSRSEGHSAVAAAAYRSGSILKDEHAGRTHRYHNRSGVADSFILAPQSAPKSLLTRAVLWNAAEASETRKNSRVAREVILALPHELSDKARAELTRDMGLYLLERYRVAVDVAIHAPTEGDGHDPRNHHAHLLFTTREVTKDGLGAKTRILDDKVSGPQEIEIIREVWETLANDALKRAGFDDIKIDRRSLEDQGVDRIPQTHEGKAARNAQSSLARDFKKADSGGEDESGEEESSGEKSSSSGSSSGGGSKALVSKEREDDKGRPIDYVTIDKEKTRTAFNTEIKTLNKQRAAFGDKPLAEQIEQLDRMMERLDKRVEKLQALKGKTTIQSAIKDVVTGMAKMAAEFISGRKESRAAIKLSKQEKHARTERHIARYGRKYRQGIHAKIADMKQNIATLETKQGEFNRYRAFVQTVEKEIANHPPSIKEPFKERSPPKRITAEELTRKLTLRADFIREHVPEKFKPQPKAACKTSSAEAALTKGKDPIIENKPTALEVKHDVKPVLKPTLGETKPHTLSQPQTPPTQRKNWFTPASEKTKPLQQLIERKLPELKATEPQVKKDQPLKQVTAREVTQKIVKEASVKRERVPPQYQPKTEKEPVKALFKGLEREIAKRTEDKKGVSLRSKFNSQTKEPEQRPEPKRASNESIIERTKEAATKLRASIPEQYHAKPYETQTKAPETTRLTEENVQPSFKVATENTQPLQGKPLPRMSEGFNAKSGFNQAAESKAKRSFGDEPEVDI